MGFGYAAISSLKDYDRSGLTRTKATCHGKNMCVVKITAVVMLLLVDAWPMEGLTLLATCLLLSAGTHSLSICLCVCLPYLVEQQKHHTGRNATFKDHVNGIKKAPNHKYKSMKGVSETTLFYLTHLFSLVPCLGPSLTPRFLGGSRGKR